MSVMVENIKNHNMQITDIDMSALHEDIDFNSRGKIVPLDVATLIRDIDKNGLIHPITIRKYTQEKALQTGFNFGIVAGFRRYNAFKCLGRPTIPCVIKYDLSDIDAKILNFRENDDDTRKDIDILQQAKSIEYLRNAGLTMQVIADKLGKSTGWVQIRISVLNFPKNIQEKCADGTINQGQIRALASLSTDKQYEAVRTLVNKKLKGEKGNLYIQRPVKQQSKRNRNKAEMQAMLDHIYDILGPSFTTRVLAWCCGNISSAELFLNIKEMCKEKGINYQIPETELL